MFVSAVNLAHTKISEHIPEQITAKPQRGRWTVLSSKTKKDLQVLHKKLAEIGDIGTGTIIEI